MMIISKYQFVALDMTQVRYINFSMCKKKTIWRNLNIAPLYVGQFTQTYYLIIVINIAIHDHDCGIRPHF